MERGENYEAIEGLPTKIPKLSIDEEGFLRRMTVMENFEIDKPVYETNYKSMIN